MKDSDASILPNHMTQLNIDLSNIHSENISVTPNETGTGERQAKKMPNEMTTTSAIKKPGEPKVPNKVFSYEETKKEYDKKQKVLSEKRLTKDPVSNKRLSGQGTAAAQQPASGATTIKKPKTSLGG